MWGELDLIGVGLQLQQWPSPRHSCSELEIIRWGWVWILVRTQGLFFPPLEPEKKEPRPSVYLFMIDLTNLINEYTTG